MAPDTNLHARATIPSHSTSTSTQTLTQDIMLNTSKKFIGAVEDEWQLFSDNAEDYTIGDPIGFGASSIVYAATYLPRSNDPSNTVALEPVPCALKVLDLDKLPPRSLQLLQRETTLMSLSKHPNVLRVRGSWMNGHKLYIALRLMNKGSAADVMRYGWPGGLEEDVVRCILRQALKGLNYLHINGFIHRDVKAANLLIDDDGTVLLGDLGVAADLAEDTSYINTSHHSRALSITAAGAMTASRSTPASIGSNSTKRAAPIEEPMVLSRPKIGKRKSFVGTPCWMAPELIQGRQYDSSADIWSFGITALELTQGRPPRSRESPQKVLLKTIQEDPPTLDRDGGAFKYSRAFKEIVDSCLHKDPSKRPTAAELLQTPFFKGAKKKSYLINTILKDLPPLTQRQERRPVAHMASANSIDSWDFATTINSPTTSVYRRRILEELVAAEGPHMEFGRESLHSSALSPQHRNLSWAAKNHNVIPVPETDEVDVVHSSSSAASDSDSLFGEKPVNGHLSSSPDTAPSSYAESSEIAVRSQAAHTLPKKTDNFVATPNHTSLQRETFDSTPVASRSQLFQQSQAKTPGSRTPKRPSTSSGTPTQQGLWSKIKSNVKRPSSRGGAEYETPGSEGKRKLGNMFSSASKGLLSRSSTRSLAAVAAVQETH
ncbi:hypothetical protein CVT24_000486 [Panaeolus cyanescens]|uniref:Protein kinase domain-containing protein n=1 Tax=Panaeolus cyanescens TaxID=181874 RepID=A0A409V8D9_9AGAR|nr:hypothetical protein CVT24_000486 [Panaeolus cyanescens]